MSLNQTSWEPGRKRVSWLGRRRRLIVISGALYLSWEKWFKKKPDINKKKSFGVEDDSLHHPTCTVVGACTQVSVQKALQLMLVTPAEGTVHWAGQPWLRCNEKSCQQSELIQEKECVSLPHTAEVYTGDSNSVFSSMGDVLAERLKNLRNGAPTVTCHFYLPSSEANRSHFPASSGHKNDKMHKILSPRVRGKMSL